MTGSPRLKGVLIILALCVYPTIYFLALLGHSKFAHFGFKTSDVDGDYQFAWLMSKQSFLSTNNKFTNFPYGENLWRWQSLTHLLPTIVIQGLAKVVSFPVAVNLYCWLGWTFSGLVVARLSHIVNKHLTISLATGVLFQMLPWNRYLLENWIHYLWSGLPLLVFVLWLNTPPNLRFKWRFNLTACLLLFVNGLVDGYWFYFSLIILISLVLIQIIPKLIHSELRWLTGIGAVVFAILIFAFSGKIKNVLGSKASSNNLSRPLEVTPRWFIDTYGGHFLDFIRPDFRHLIFKWDSRLVSAGWEVNPIQYLGLPLLALSFFGFVVAVRKKKQTVIQLGIITGVFIGLSLQTSVLGIPTLSGLLREVTPGLLWVWRASIIAEAIMLVLAAYMLVQFVKRRHGLTVIFLMILIILDLNPFGGRRVVDASKPWMEISKILTTSPNSRILFLPTVMPTQSWMEQVFTGVPMVNGLYESKSIGELKALDDIGECQTLIWLLEKRITHVIGIKDYEKILGIKDLANLNPKSLNPLFFSQLIISRIVIVGNWESEVVMARIKHAAIYDLCFNPVS